MSVLDLEFLLKPLSDDMPCGKDPEYEPPFLALEKAAEGKPEQQYGNTIIPAESPDWRQVRERALEVFEISRDLRAAVWLARSGARLNGLAGAVAGLQLVHRLLMEHWDHVHPVVDEAGVTMRMNALHPLAHTTAGLADFRAAGLSSGRAGLLVRHAELAFGRAELMPGELTVTPEGVLQGAKEAVGNDPALIDFLVAGRDAVQGICKVLDDKVGPVDSPDLTPLLKLMQALAELEHHLRQTQVELGGGAIDDAGSVVVATRGSGPINSRADALHSLDKVCEWLERNEPTNPAPLLIRRAQRLMTKSFVEIIRDLMPEGVGQIEKLAGLGGE